MELVVTVTRQMPQGEDSTRFELQWNPREGTIPSNSERMTGGRAGDSWAPKDFLDSPQEGGERLSSKGRNWMLRQEGGRELGDWEFCAVRSQGRGRSRGGDNGKRNGGTRQEALQCRIGTAPGAQGALEALRAQE